MIEFLSRLISKLSLPKAMLLGRLIGKFWYYVIPIRKAVALKNVERVFKGRLNKKQQKALVKRCFENTGMYAIDGLRLPLLTPEWIAENVTFEGREHYEQAKAKGKGVIFIAGHFGSFDLCACVHAMSYPPVHVVFKTIKWRAAHDFWFKIRALTGIVAIPPKKSKEQIKEALTQGHAVAFPSDQHMAKHRAIVCTFFSELAATTPAPVRFAYQTGAAIIPAVMFRTNKDGQHRFRYEKELILESPYETEAENIKHNTQRINHIYERWVLEAPDQWLWQHKRWKVQDNTEGWDIT